MRAGLIRRIIAEEGLADDETDVLVGDMMLSDDQMKYLYSMDSTKRFGLAQPFYQWPKATVVYNFDASLQPADKSVVVEAMNYIQNVSCVRFKVKDKALQHYVLIKHGRACSSKVGMRRGGPQQMIIDSGLCSKGSIIHELLHCLGFLHQHMSDERDHHIDIHWNNIKDDAKVNFKRITAHVSMFKTDYDYDSILHYSSIAFAKNKSRPTITAKRPAPNMGQRKGEMRGLISQPVVKLYYVDRHHLYTFSIHFQK